jgi:hypothetical protein
MTIRTNFKFLQTYRILIQLRASFRKSRHRSVCQVPLFTMVSIFLMEALHRKHANSVKASAGAPNNPEDPLSILLADFSRDLHVDTTSVFIAAQQAALSFKNLLDHMSKSFIYTGNVLNETTVASILDGGVGKSATAHIIRSAAAACRNKGFKYVFSSSSSPAILKLTKSRFYYADEQKADGYHAYSETSGEAHGKFYAELTEKKSQGSWQQTFVKAVGYKHFPAS